MKNNKKILVMIALISSLWAIAAHADHTSDHKGHGNETAGGNSKSVEAPAKCQVCNMDRTQFSYARAIVTFEDGSSTGTCSITCAREVIGGKPKKKVKSIQVADFNSKKLIDARKATWVVGGDKQGVMTSVPKWAFLNKADAQKFIKLFGGKISRYDDLFKAAAK